MNPARTFGTAVVQNNWDNHWVLLTILKNKLKKCNLTIANFFFKVYWAGPILGGITAGLLYSQALSAPEEEQASDKYRTAANDKEVILNNSIVILYLFYK